MLRSTGTLCRFKLFDPRTYWLGDSRSLAQARRYSGCGGRVDLGSSGGET